MLDTTKAKKALRKDFQWGGLGKELVDKLLDNSKWSIQMVSAPKAKSAEVLSKIGGFPNLPSDIEWPIYQGEPMAFIAQMDLAEIPNAKDFGLPSKGVLFFFYDSNQSWGFSKTNAGAAQVIYVEERSLIPHKAKIIKKYIKDIWDSYKIITKEKRFYLCPNLCCQHILTLTGIRLMLMTIQVMNILTVGVVTLEAITGCSVLQTESSREIPLARDTEHL